MKKRMKRIVAWICTLVLVSGVLTTFPIQQDAQASEGSADTVVYLPDFRNVTTSSFYTSSEATATQMPNEVSVDGGEEANLEDTVAYYSTMKDMQGNIIANHHKTLLSVYVDFENDSCTYSTRLEVAGAEDNLGFRIYPELGQLRLEALGIQSEAGVFRFATDTVTTLADKFVLQLSFEYGDFDSGSEDNDVKVGVYINGKLGTADYLVGDAMAVDNHAIFYNCDMTKLGTFLKLYTENADTACDLSVEAVVPENPNLTKITWSDFNESGTETPATDTVFSSPADEDRIFVLNKENIECMSGTSFEAKIKFGSDGGGDVIYYGGCDSWRGLQFYPTIDGSLAMVANNTDLAPDLGFQDGVAFFDPVVAQLVDKTFLNHEFILKITMEYGDFNEDGDSNDVQLGFYFDGKLYNNQYCYANNYKNSTTIGNVIGVHAMNTTISIKSVTTSSAVNEIDAKVEGVYKDSENGQIQVVLKKAGVEELPMTATYEDVSLVVSDGTDTHNYTVSGNLSDEVLSLNLADKMTEDKTYTITVQAGVYANSGQSTEKPLKITEDFICYQDQSSDVIYQKVGKTTLVEGENFNGGAPADGELYLVGDDLTGQLQDYVTGYAGEWWTINLVPLNAESGVFRNGTKIESECDVWYPTESDTQFYISVGTNKADGDIFTVKGQFKVINNGNDYKGYNNVIELDSSKIMYFDGSWSTYVEPQGPLEAKANVKGVYKGSINGQVRLVLEAVEATTLPATGTCADVAVTISNGTTTADYTVGATLMNGNLLTLDLADKMTAEADYTVTVKAGTYSGTTDEQDLSLEITEDFICYQDKSSTVIYQQIGSTVLTAGANFNGGNVAAGELYLVGDDLTGKLQDYVTGYAGEWWTISLEPLNEESGVYRNGKRMTEGYIIQYPTESDTQFYIGVGANKADGDVFTIKGKFKVVNADGFYKDYQDVIQLEASSWQYKNTLWSVESSPSTIKHPNSSFKKITFSHFKAKDKVYTNGGTDEFQFEGKANLSLNKTLFCGKIKFESDGNYYFAYGGKDNIWHGLRVDVTQYGGWHVYWIDDDGTSLTGDIPIISMDSNGAQTPLFDTMLDFMLSTEIVDADGDGKKNDIQFGFWFNDVLYNNEYIVVKNRAKQLGSRFGVMARGKGVSFELKSIPELVEAVDPEAVVTMGEDFKKITFSHFGIMDGKYKYTPDGFSAMGKTKISLDKTLFSGDVFLPKGKDFDFRYGGKEHGWYGLQFDIEPRNVMHIVWQGEQGGEYLLTDISNSKAQTTLFGQWVNLKISTEIVDADGDGKKNDIRFGVWFNDIPYNDDYIIVYNQAGNLGNYLGIVCSEKGSYMRVRSVEELVEPFDYAAYGLNKNWKKGLLDTGLSSDIPRGGSKEDGPFSGDSTSVAMLFVFIGIGIVGIGYGLYEKRRKRLL